LSRPNGSLIFLSDLPVFVVQKTMMITLNPEQEAQIKTRVASGDFASVEEAARQLIEDALVERALGENDDMAWAKPYVDEALTEVACGEGITLEEHKARNAARLAALRT
jgi:antitoxin ParD1/3/4